MYETDRLILRKAEFRDWEAMYRNVWSHPEAAGYTRKWGCCKILFCSSPIASP